MELVPALMEAIIDMPPHDSQVGALMDRAQRPVAHIGILHFTGIGMKCD